MSKSTLVAGSASRQAAQLLKLLRIQTPGADQGVIDFFFL
jgi:hypothetical protein